MGFWNISHLQVGDYFSKMLILIPKTFFLIVLTLIWHGLWRGRKRRIWELRSCRLEMAQLPKGNFEYWQKGVLFCFVLNFLFWRKLKRYGNSTMNFHMPVTCSHQVVTCGMFALLLFVFAEWPQSLEPDTSIHFISSLALLDYVLWSVSQASHLVWSITGAHTGDGRRCCTSAPRASITTELRVNCTRSLDICLSCKGMAGIHSTHLLLGLLLPPLCFLLLL